MDVRLKDLTFTLKKLNPFVSFLYLSLSLSLSLYAKKSYYTLYLSVSLYWCESV